MPTAQVIVDSALRKIGALESGESPSADEGADALEALNDLLSAWSAETWKIPYRTRDNAMSIPSAANSYTIGSGGDFNTARPISIHSITINQGSTQVQLYEGSLQQFNREKVAQEGIPRFYYYEPNYPLGIIYFPYKLSTGNTLTVDSLKPFTSFSTLATNIDLPPGYEHALKSMLAIMLADEYGAAVTNSMAKMAADAESFLRTQSLQHRVIDATVDPVLISKGSGGYNIITDGP